MKITILLLFFTCYFGFGQGNGDIDTSFNNVTAPVGFNGNAINKIEIQSDNKILCAGNYISSYNGITISNFCRLNVNGDIDTIFIQNLGLGVNGPVRDIYLYDNGKILIVGSFTEVNGVPSTGIARLNYDGSLDLTFISPLINMTYGVYSVAVQSDGKILIGGSFTQVSTFPRNAIARLNSDGTLDASLTSPFAWNDFVKKIDTASNSNILVLNNNNIYKLNSNGSINSGFNSVYNNYNYKINDFIELNNGKILLGGYSTPTGSTKYSFIKRINSNGTNDYSSNGQFGSNNQIYCMNCEVKDFERYSSNKIIVGGRLTDLGHRNVMIIDEAGNSLNHFIYSNSIDAFIYGNKVQNFNKIITYGQFNFLQNKEVNHIARLNFNDTCFITGINIDTTVCGSYYTSPSGNYTWSVSGSYSDTLINSCGLDSIINILLTFAISNPINTNITQNNITLTTNETNGDSYNLIECNTNDIWYNTTSIVDVPSPGTYAIEIIKNGCIDTTDCITITNQDFYNLPNYIPLTAEVFAYPVTSLDSCNASALAFANGGFPPYNFDWFTQINNDYSDINDSVCEGFHTLKIYDMIGDSIFVDYYVTDSVNWYNWYNNLTPYVDTIYMVDQNCSVDMNNPIDSSIISNFYYLYGSTNVNEDYFYMEITYFQSGTQFTFGDTVLMNPNGDYLICFSIICPNKAISRIKTIVTSMNPEILNINAFNLNKTVIIYPNPTTGDINLNLGEYNSRANISIFDLSGKIVYKKNNINDNSITFSIQSIESGIYFVKIEMNNRQQVIKLIKE